MPCSQFTVPTGGATPRHEAEVAAAMTNVHSEVIGAPRGYVNRSSIEVRRRPSSCQVRPPATRMVGVREGRSAEIRAKLLRGLADARASSPGSRGEVAPTSSPARAGTRAVYATFARTHIWFPGVMKLVSSDQIFPDVDVELRMLTEAGYARTGGRSFQCGSGRAYGGRSNPPKSAFPASSASEARTEEETQCSMSTTT